MKTQSKHIVFITGAFVSHNGWSEWQKYFEQQGYTTVAPAWPHKGGTAEYQRSLHPNNTPLADLTLAQVVDSYAKVIQSLPEKPILIGHSLGGLITQILLNRGTCSCSNCRALRTATWCHSLRVLIPQSRLEIAGSLHLDEENLYDVFQRLAVRVCKRYEPRRSEGCLRSQHDP